MTDENVSKSQKGTTPPDNTDVDGLKIKAGDSMNLDDTPPSDDREQVEGEDTPINEPEPKPTLAGTLDEVEESLTREPAKEEAEEEVERPGKAIRKLGEEKKAIAEQLIELARTGGKKLVIKQIKSNPDLEKYFRSKFGEDFESAFEEDKKLDEEAIRKEERIRVKAETLQQQLKDNKAKELEVFAQNLGYNSDELALLEESAAALEGAVVGGKTLDWNEALEKAALVVNYNKASAKFKVPSGGQLPTGDNPEPKKIPVTPELKKFTGIVYGSSRTPEDVAKGIERVNEQLDENGTLRLSLD